MLHGHTWVTIRSTSVYMTWLRRTWRTTVSRRLSLPAVPVCVLPTLSSWLFHGQTQAIIMWACRLNLVSRPTCICESVRAGWAGSGTTQTAAAAAAYQLSQPLLTWQHNKKCHVRACRSCCELIETHVLSTHRSRVVARRRCLIPAHMRVTNFC